MIKRKVALVLGAGASVPFGFPTGPQLKAQIIRDLDPGAKSEMRAHLNEIGLVDEDIRKFWSALYYSGKRSVDAFLEHRPEFLKVGKAATACALVPCENQRNLFAAGEENWYEYLFQKMNASFDEFERNAVAVLSFNYDRSLEQYLMTALSNTYGKSTEDCATKLRQIPIIHLYGQLGSLAGLGDQPVGYGAHLDAGTLKIAANGIQIVHEDIGGQEQFTRAHAILRATDLICFVGFGYDETNLQRIMNYGPTAQQRVLGSAYGLTLRERQLIAEKIRVLGIRECQLEGGYPALDFLRYLCPFD